MKKTFLFFSLWFLPALIFPFTVTLGEDSFFFPGSKPDVAEYNDANISLKPLTLTAQDGVVLSGAVAYYKGSHDYFFFFYGNGNSLFESVPRMKYISGHYKMNVVCFDYRGYGKSGGKPGFDIIQNDAQTIFNTYAPDAYKNKGAIFLLGRSMGSLPSLHLATTQKVNGLILETCWTEAKEVVPSMMEGQNALFQFLVQLKADASLEKRTDQPVHLIQKLKIPLLVVHGSNDEVFPLRVALKMYDLAPSKNKFFCLVPGAKHANIDICVDPALKAMDDFIGAYR